MLGPKHVTISTHLLLSRDDGRYCVTQKTWPQTEEASCLEVLLKMQLGCYGVNALIGTTYSASSSPLSFSSPSHL